MSKRRSSSSSKCPTSPNPTSPSSTSVNSTSANSNARKPDSRSRNSANPPGASESNNHNLSNTKRTGERSEAAFLYQATQRAFGICKPWGDSERYDFILDNRPKPEVHLFRVQVKCTDSLRAGAYETRATYTTGKGRAVYTKRDIDFLAAHVVELNIWYIVPVEICTPAPMLRFYPHRKAKKMRLEKYREAWHLLDPPFTPITIHACVDPDYPDEDYPEGYTPAEP